jgi:hypothetical protein
VKGCNENDKEQKVLLPPLNYCESIWPLTGSGRSNFFSRYKSISLQRKEDYLSTCIDTSWVNQFNRVQNTSGFHHGGKRLG